MQVNPNCKILFKFGTGVNSVEFILLGSSTFCLSVPGVPVQHVSTWSCGCCQSGWEKRGALDLGKPSCLSPVLLRCAGLWAEALCPDVCGHSALLCERVLVSSSWFQRPRHSTWLPEKEGNRTQNPLLALTLYSCVLTSNLFGYVVQCKYKAAFGFLQLKKRFVFC